MRKKLIKNIYEQKKRQSKLLLIMRLSLLLTITGLINLNATGFSQLFTITGSNLTVKEVIETIEKKSDYKFLYQNELIENTNEVSLEVYGQPIEKVLNQLLSQANIGYRMFDDKLIVLTRADAVLLQTVTIKGKVTGVSSGEPVPGATVLVKGTTNGTSTDENGNFKLEIPNANGIIIVSSVGYLSEEIEVAGRTNLEIKLVEDIQKLEEVVVVGYGTQKKSDITGSIATISEKSLRVIPAGNIASALQGMGAGVDIQKNGGNSHPGSTPVIRIRGERSLSGGNDPLIILDGIPYDGSLNDVNPDDITSIQVLKDASSTAIYGARGSNGVLLIQTQRGKEQKATVNYNGYGGFNKPLGKYNMMNAEQFTQFKKWAKFNGMKEGTYTGLDDPQLITDMFTDATEYTGYINGIDTDWQDLIYKTSIVTNHQLGLSGGTSKTKYATSVGYYNSTGVYEKQGMERYTIKLSVDQQMGKYVKIGLNTLNSYTILTGLDVNPMSQALQATPLLSPYNDDGTLKGFLGNSQNVYNPLKDFQNGAILDDKIRFSTFTTGYLDIDFTHGFKYKLNTGIQLNPETHQKYYSKETTKQLGIRNWGYNNSTKGYNYTIENIFTYDKTIAGKHNINFTGLYSIQEFEKQWFSTQYNDVVIDNVGYYNPSLASNQTSDGWYEKSDMLSYMGRLNYNFKEKYLLTLTLRSDGSSRLAEGSKWQTFPSGAIGWNIAKESFMQNLGFISALKFRASYGTVGSAAVGIYQTTGGLSSTKYNFGTTNVLGYYPTDATNHSLRWEETTTSNIGLDFGFLSNRINGSVEVYMQDTKNLLMDQALPATSGIPNKMKANIGKTENKGMEFNVRSVNFDGDGAEGFYWSTDMNIFLTRQKITQLSTGVKEDKINNWFIGEPNGVYYDYKRIGIWQNTPEDSAMAKSYGLTTTGSTSVIGTVRVDDSNDDGKINDEDKVILGYRQPKFEAGMTNSFAYKNFDFTFVLYLKVGGMMRSGIHEGWMNTFQAGYNNVNIPYWTPENRENYWPKPNAAKQNPDYKSTLCYMEATYLKLRTMTLGYTVPANLLGRLNVQSTRVYATVSNPLVLFSRYVDEFDGLDPETNGNLDLNTPAMWSMLFGVNITF